MMRASVAVIGAGPGGLGVAAALQTRGVRAVVFERAAAVAPVWRQSYDRLRLNTGRARSYLPGTRMPVSVGRWPTRQQFVDYLDSYVQRHGLDVRTDTTIERVDPDGDGWLVRVDGGGVERFAQVIVAAGYNSEPVVPEWPGAERFTGAILHSSAYRNGAPFTGKRAVVVGIGNSGADIAVDLLEHGATVSLVVRTPPHIVPREPFGIPADIVGIALRRLPVSVGDRMVDIAARPTIAALRRCGLHAPTEGAMSRHRRDGAEPTIDSGILRALKRSEINVLPGTVVELTDDSVRLSSGSLEPADVLIAATGYRNGLASLVGHLDILDGRHRPRVRAAATDPQYPGLRFVGYTLPISGNLRELRHEARRVSAAVACDLRAAGWWRVLRCGPRQRASTAPTPAN